MHIPGLLGVGVFWGEQSQELECPFPNGFYRLGNIKPDVPKIELTSRLNPGLIPIHVDRGKNVSRIRVTKGERLRIRILLNRKEGDNNVSAVYPGNHLRFISLVQNKIVIWEIAVVSQEEALFITFQETFNISLKEGIGGVLYGPGTQLQKWPQMKSFLETFLGRQLLIIPEENPKKVRVGRVIWYNLAQGLGAIQTPNGAARVRWSEVAPRQRGFQYLVRGEAVTYHITPIAPIAPKPGVRPTAFKWEAKEVAPA